MLIEDEKVEKLMSLQTWLLFFFEKPMKYALTSYRVGILIRTLELISVCVSLWFTPLFITLEQLLMAAVKKAYCHVESYNCICLYQLNLNMELANPGTWKHRML